MKIIQLILFVLIFSACNSQKNNPIAKDLNNKAINILISNNDSNIQQLQMGLNYLDSAIKIDSNYLTAYTNKISFLIKLKRQNDAILVCDYLINRKYSVAELYMMEGFIYENKGDSIRSIKNYILARNNFKDRIQKDQNKVSNQINLIFSEFMISNDKKEALKEIEILKNKFPQNVEIENMQELIKDFNRGVYLQQF